MSIKTNLLICVFLFSIIVGCKKDSPTKTDNQAKTIHDLLVKETDFSGWSYSGSACAASNYNELTVCIDGPASIYQSHGYVESEDQRYHGTPSSTSANIYVAVYNQGTSANALAVYNDSRLGFNGAIDWNAAGHAGDAAHYIYNSGLSYQLAFYRNNYYVYIDIDVDIPTSLDIIQQFALNVDGKIPH